MNTTVVTWSDNYGTGQIYSSGLELSLCSDDNKQVGTFVYCKDFFQDAIVASIHKMECDVYGYKYSPGKMPDVPKENLKILMTNSMDPNLEKKMENVVDFINQFEEKLGLNKTVVEKCENPMEKYKKCGIFLLTGDKRWMTAPPALSMWTLLARTGVVHTKGEQSQNTIRKIIEGGLTPAQKNDKVFIEYGKNGMDLIMEKGVEGCFGTDMVANYPKQHAGHTMHHYSGIVSYSSKKAKKYFPNWVYPEKELSPPGVCFS